MTTAAEQVQNTLTTSTWTGGYVIGGPSEDQWTPSVFQTYVVHLVISAAMEKVSDSGLKASLTQTLSKLR